MIFIAIGVILLLLSGIGVFFLVRDTQYQLAGGKDKWKLRKQEKELREIEEFSRQLDNHDVDRELHD